MSTSTFTLSLDSTSLAYDVLDDVPSLRNNLNWTSSNTFNVSDRYLEDVLEALNSSNVEFTQTSENACNPGLAYS